MCCALLWPLLLLPDLIFFFSNYLNRSLCRQHYSDSLIEKKDGSLYHTWDSSRYTLKEQDKVFLPTILRDHWRLHEAADGFAGTAISIYSFSCMRCRKILMIHLLLSDIASCEKEVYWLTNPIFDKITFLICPWCMWNRQMIPNFFLDT